METKYQALVLFGFIVVLVASGLYNSTLIAENVHEWNYGALIPPPEIFVILGVLQGAFATSILFLGIAMIYILVQTKKKKYVET